MAPEGQQLGQTRAGRASKVTGLTHFSRGHEWWGRGQSQPAEQERISASYSFSERLRIRMYSTLIPGSAASRELVLSRDGSPWNLRPVHHRPKGMPQSPARYSLVGHLALRQHVRHESESLVIQAQSQPLHMTTARPGGQGRV